MKSAASRLGMRGLVLTYLALTFVVTFMVFPFVIMPAMDRLVEWQVRHG